MYIIHIYTQYTTGFTHNIFFVRICIRDSDKRNWTGAYYKGCPTVDGNQKPHPKNNLLDLYIYEIRICVK